MTEHGEQCPIFLRKRITELEAELAKANEAGEVLHAKYRELDADVSRLRDIIAALEHEIAGKDERIKALGKVF